MAATAAVEDDQNGVAATSREWPPRAQQQPNPGMSRLPPGPLFESNWHEPVAQSRTQPLWSRPFSTKPNSAQAQQQPDPAEARLHLVHHLVTQI
ncbi:hypothetical protein V6N11_052088 [Hibiscus sabdariffa]|uniref:Uncharacterized protein n=1 Tax=Hibiscus sabdariffa TaxID=183260 RepID=A0ABR2U9F4_9ROSI